MIPKKIFAFIFGVSLFVMSTCSASEIIVKTDDDESGWFLSIMKIDEEVYSFLVMNQKTEQGAIIPYNHKNYNFYYDESPFIFLMAVNDSPSNIDYDLGEWREDIHLMPVHAQFNYSDEDEQVSLESDLSSCQGLTASNYQGRIKSPYHIKLVEVFLTQMPALHKAVEDDGIDLP